MVTITKKWGIGTGAVTIEYNGSGDGIITITSDGNNLYEQRSIGIVTQKIEIVTMQDGHLMSTSEGVGPYYKTRILFENNESISIT
jgi:hypothetical protein